MKSISLRIALLLTSLVGSFAVAEVLYRVFGPREAAEFVGVAGGGGRGPVQQFEIRVLDERGVRVPIEQVARPERLVVDIEPAPRPRKATAPGQELFICFPGYRQPYFDAEGCVPVRINSCGIREREELCAPKPAGQTRIVCVGDSFTYGWGVRAEDTWVRLVENALRRHDDGIRTVNCGLAGTMYLDEYQWGLKYRFHRFEPDVVVVTLCLNDLLRTNGGLAHYRAGVLPDVPSNQRAWWQNSKILRSLARAYEMPDRLKLDPTRDWVSELIDADQDPRFWGGGGAQAALLGMRDWCREHSVRFGVVLWPFFQGLGDGEFYPFATMHELCAELCRAEGIPFLDLLPAFRGHDTASLWVTPLDLHGNDVAQRIAAEPVARFVGGLLP